MPAFLEVLGSEDLVFNLEHINRSGNAKMRHIASELEGSTWRFQLDPLLVGASLTSGKDCAGDHQHRQLNEPINR